jgi:hypothetical protein
VCTSLLQVHDGDFVCLFACSLVHRLSCLLCVVVVGCFFFFFLSLFFQLAMISILQVVENYHHKVLVRKADGDFFVFLPVVQAGR